MGLDTKKELRACLRTKRKFLADVRSVHEEKTQLWQHMDVLAKDLDNQIEATIPPKQEPKPETLHVEALKELNHAERMENDILDHTQELELKLTKQKVRLTNASQVVQPEPLQWRKLKCKSTTSGRTRPQETCQVMLPTLSKTRPRGKANRVSPSKESRSFFHSCIWDQRC